mgnify:CR=1 FL=1
MKNIFLISSVFVLLFTLSASSQVPKKPHVVILTTGGTIASRSNAPSLEGPDLVQAVPQILDYATVNVEEIARTCLLYTSPSPRDGLLSRMPSSA